jgi:catechol 2,3-dioxygenase
MEAHIITSCESYTLPCLIFVYYDTIRSYCVLYSLLIGGQVTNNPSALFRGYLLYIHIGTPAPESLARFYAELFGMNLLKTGQAWMCCGANRYLVFSEGPPNTLLSAGYAVADESVLEGLAARAAPRLIGITEIESELLGPGALAFRDPDANRIAYGVPRAPTYPQNHNSLPARLQHFVMGTTDVLRMTKFYTSVVGLQESDLVQDDDNGVRACFMRSDDEHHSFAVFCASGIRLDHHCYELPNWNSVRDWADRLAARHIPVKWGPGRHGPGNNLFLFFHDPEGNWVELSTELELVAGARAIGIWRHEERTLNSWGRGHLRS